MNAPAHAATAQGERRRFVVFQVGGHACGVDIAQVREIARWSPPTALPNQPPSTLGVLNLRGTIVPVHDLRARFGEGPTEATDAHVVVIAWIGARTVGVLADAVSDIVDVAAERIRPAPAAADSAPPALLGLVDAGDGVAAGTDGLIALLDLEALFGAGEDGPGGRAAPPPNFGEPT